MSKFLSALGSAYLRLISTVSKFRSLFLLFLAAFAVSAFLPAASIYAFCFAISIGVVASGYEIYSSIQKQKKLDHMLQESKQQDAKITNLVEELKKKQQDNQHQELAVAQLEAYKKALKRFEFLLQSARDRLVFSLGDKAQQKNIADALAEILPAATQDFSMPKTTEELVNKKAALTQVNDKLLQLVLHHTSEEEKSEYIRHHQSTYNEAFLETPKAPEKNKTANAHKPGRGKTPSSFKPSLKLGFNHALGLFGLGFSLTVAIASFILPPAALIALPVSTILLTTLGLLTLATASCVATSVVHYKYVAPREAMLTKLENEDKNQIKNQRILTLENKINYENKHQKLNLQMKVNLKENIATETLKAEQSLTMLRQDVMHLQESVHYSMKEQFDAAHPGLARKEENNNKKIKRELNFTPPQPDK